MNIFKKRNFTQETIADNPITDDLIEQVRLYALSSLSSQRYDHSIRVAKLAMSLCQKFGENEKNGYLAGLSHDICKEMDRGHLIETATNNGEVLSVTELKKPSLLHGRLSAIVLKDRFYVTNTEILEAVTCHTFGKKNMSNLAKIICVADKIEPGRPYMSSAKMKNLLKLNLDDLLYKVLKEIIEFRKKKNDEVYPEALWVYDKNLNNNCIM